MASEALKLEGNGGFVDSKRNNINEPEPNMYVDNASIDSKNAVNADVNNIAHLDGEEHLIGNDVTAETFDSTDRFHYGFELSGQLNYDSDFGVLLGIPCLDSVISFESFDITKDVYQDAEPIESAGLFLENIEDLFHDHLIDIGDNSVLERDVSVKAKLYDPKDIDFIDAKSIASRYRQASSSDSRQCMPNDHSSCRGSRCQEGVIDYQCHLCKYSYVTFQDFESHCQSHYDYNNNTKSDKQKWKTCNIFEIFDDIKMGPERKHRSANNEHNNIRSKEYRVNKALENTNKISSKTIPNQYSEENNVSLEYSVGHALESDSSINLKNKSSHTSRENEQSYISCKTLLSDNTSLSADIFLHSDVNSLPPDNTNLHSDITSQHSDNNQPSDHIYLPSDINSPPSDNNYLPSDIDSLPSDNSCLHSDDNSLPSDQKGLPPDNTSLPSESNGLPSDNTSLPSNNSLPSRDISISPSFEIVFNNNLPMVEENRPSIHINHKKTADKLPFYPNKRLYNPQHSNNDNIAVRNCVVDIGTVTTPQDDNVNKNKQRKHRRNGVKSLRSATHETNAGVKKKCRSSNDSHIAPEQSDIQIHFCQKCGKSFNRNSSLKTHLKAHETTVQIEQSRHLKPWECSICNIFLKNEQSLKQHKLSHLVSKPNKCDVCCKFFRRKKHLERHRANHEKLKRVACGVCGKLYKKNTIRQHVQSHHHQKRFNCEVCGKSFIAKHVLESHTRMHTGSKPYECHICHKRFASKPILHMRLHSGEKPYECDICGKRFNIFKNMRRHLVIHTGLKPYQCEICEKSFNDPGALKTHKRIHTGEAPYSCDVCDKAFRTSCDLTRHRRIHSGYKPFKCTVCGKCFQQRYTLRSHLEIHTGYTKSFKCNVCCKSFRTKGSLKTHMKTHTGEKPFTCPKCPKIFSTSSSLSLHDRVHTKEKPFSCNECGRAFSLRSNMMRHIRTHTGETPYECLICKKRFTNPHGVLYHEQMHKGEKAHGCPVCVKSFQSKNLLQQHLLRNHYDEKRFKCSDCDKSFKSNTELKAHAKSHSDANDYKCEICYKSFKHRSSLLLHIKSHVGD